MSSWFRLALRLQRFELAALTAVAALLALASILIAIQLGRITAAYPYCFGSAAEGGRACIAAQADFAPWDQVAENLLWLGWVAPVVLGAVWAVPIVAREVEQQTAALVWSLSVSRLRWLAGRSLPVFAYTVGLLAIVGLSAEILTQARIAGSDPGFARYDQRGLVLPLRGALAFAVALAVGAIVGRTLPSLIAGIAITAVMLFAVSLGLDQWRRADAEVVLVGATQGSSISQGLVLEPVAVMPDGSVVPEREADGLPEGSFTDAVLVLPATRYWLWLGREASLVGALTVVAAAGGAYTVAHRRPL